jgi:lipopolysaccharide export system ATP-binding protein
VSGAVSSGAFLPSTSALCARGLRAVLGGAEILRGVDLDLEPGQVLGVLGPSGAGKSTLFRVIAGEIAADAGEVQLHGRVVTRAPLWKRARLGLGYVPQTPSVLLDLSVADNLRTFERVAGARSIPAHDRAKRVGLEGRLNVAAGELSGGERRRLELLRAIIAEPTVLILDEPLTGVDPVGAGLVKDAVRELAQKGTAILLADHRVPEALAICDSAALLVDGQLDLVVAARDFADHPAVRRHYLG